MSDRPDLRRVCDLSPVELLEAAFAALAGLGWSRGSWDVTLRLEEGRVRRALPSPAERPMRVTVGRRQLELGGGVEHPGELGSAA